MRIRARKLIIAVAVAALALSNSVSARHALAGVPHHAGEAANAHAHAGDDRARHAHKHDVAPASEQAEHEHASPSGPTADRNCCAALCSGMALLFAAPSLQHAAPFRDYFAAPTRLILLSALNSLDPPPR